MSPTPVEKNVAQTWVASIFETFDWVMAIEWDETEVTFIDEQGHPSSASEYRRYTVTRTVMEAMDRDFCRLPSETWRRP